MTFNPLKVIGKCVAGDAELFANMDAAIARGYPEVTRQPEREGVIALVGSGPSAVAQLDVIGEMKRAGTPIVGIKDAHDWLQDNGIIPDYALAIDPQALVHFGEVGGIDYKTSIHARLDQLGVCQRL